MTRSLSRRAILCVALGVLATACAKKPRCRHCGMVIDPASAWRADLLTPEGAVSFDTPRCALTSWRSGTSRASGLRVQDYYDRQWRNAEELRFVIGGDVVGPMGPDLVPVDPARATKFIQDHGANRALRLDELTLDVLRTLQ